MWKNYTINLTNLLLPLIFSTHFENKNKTNINEDYDMIVEIRARAQLRFRTIIAMHRLLKDKTGSTYIIQSSDLLYCMVVKHGPPQLVVIKTWWPLRTRCSRKLGLIILPGGNYEDLRSNEERRLTNQPLITSLLQSRRLQWWDM